MDSSSVDLRPRFYDVTWLSFSSREPTVVAGKLARTLLLDSIACPKPGQSILFKLCTKHTLQRKFTDLFTCLLYDTLPMLAVISESL